MRNTMELKIEALSVNEGFARAVAGAFAARLDPTIEELNDIKTAVSEAVTNAVVHAYPRGAGEVLMRGEIEGQEVTFEIADRGRGIADTEEAMQPFFTTLPGEERSGMGFTVMQTFMDELKVISEKGKGTRVIMRKRVGVCRE